MVLSSEAWLAPNGGERDYKTRAVVAVAEQTEGHTRKAVSDDAASAKTSINTA
jgi:hypothetical protein